MCGIAGFYISETSRSDLEPTVRRMGQAIQARGPDDTGVWIDSQLPLALVHRRLSILELSAAGHQPMMSLCGRYALIFNGEIYNHLELRLRLAAAQTPAWRGHSDTETLLACFAAWGVEKTLQATVGMFALALWDRHRQILTFARDRMGEKPLYWGWQQGLLLFGSELKSLKAHPAFHPQVDRDALTLLLRHGYIPAPYSIYQGIQKLRPGHYLNIPLGKGTGLAQSVVSEAYWEFNDVVASGLANPFTGTDSEAIDTLETQLKASIRAQMLSDVPLGAFLSGGIDSSTTVALMQVQSSQPVKTFTIGLENGYHDEAVHAKAVASYLGTNHTELYVTAQDTLNVIPKLSTIYCEPLSADSQIPIYLISQLARQTVTVALSGDGGDELFGGYNRYLTAKRVWSQLQRMPKLSRQALVRLLRVLSPAGWDRLFSVLEPILPNKLRIAIPGTKAQKLADILEYSDEKTYFLRLTSHWKNPNDIVIGGSEPPTLLTDHSAWPSTDCFEHSMMAMDAQAFLPEEVLAKVDRAAMANSLETRTPMIDHRVVELTWRMPLSLKIRNGQGKWLLRQVLYKHVPKELIERPKRGFGIPIDAWLRGPLKEWAESLLSESRLRADGYFNAEPIRKLWQEHLSGKYNWQYQLWPILMFQAWLAENR